MHSLDASLNNRPPFDPLLEQIAAYVADFQIASPEAYETARYCLMDSLGCAMLALNYSACTKLLGPVVADMVVPCGSRVPGTKFVLDPIAAAFNIGTLIRWLVSTTPGSPPNGVIPPTTWARSWPSLTSSADGT